MSVKVLAIAGSPRKSGNTETLLDLMIESAAGAGASCDKIRVCDLNISGCMECGACEKTGACVIRDDMPGVFPRFLAADAVVIATPVFFMNTPSQLKAFIDRFQCQWSKKYLLKQPLRENEKTRRGYSIAIGGTKGPSLFNGLNLLLKCFFPIVDIEFDEERSLFYRSVDEKGAIMRHETAADDARRLGLHIAAGE